MVCISCLSLHSITDFSSERESIAKDDTRAYVGGVIRLRSSMNDDETSQQLDGEACARIMRHRRAVLEIRLMALVGKKMIFVIHESEQNGFDSGANVRAWREDEAQPVVRGQSEKPCGSCRYDPNCDL